MLSEFNQKLYLWKEFHPFPLPQIFCSE